MWDKILESQRKLRKRNDLELAVRIEKQLLHLQAQGYTRYGRNHANLGGTHKNQCSEGKAKFQLELDTRCARCFVDERQ